MQKSQPTYNLGRREYFFYSPWFSLSLIKCHSYATYREQRCMSMQRFLVILNISSCHFNHTN